MSTSHRDDIWRAADMAAEKGDHQTLVLELEALYRQGVHSSAARIGELYELGAVGLQGDVEKALYWYSEAVHCSEDPLAYLGLGRLYFYGRLIEGGHDQAKQFFETAFKAGVLQAGIFLGIIELQQSVDSDEAVSYFAAAAKAGFPVGYRYLSGLYYRRGKYWACLLMLLRAIYGELFLMLQDRYHPNLWKV